MFGPVGSKVSFPQLEERILELWKEKRVFKRSVEARKGGKRFVLYEGPPTANGSPGIHHVLSRIYKDIIPRYKVMKGYYAPRFAGWDTHGLPVELEVEKTLGLSNKTQIEEYGIDKFNARCRESVFRYLKEWDALTERIAFWINLEHPYITMNNTYIESVWWSIKQMWDKGLIYQGHRVTPHCPRCGTSLSSHEVALGYKENTEDPSVYIKFKLIPFDSTSEEEKRRYGKAKGFGCHLIDKKPKAIYFLVWTTTPWTLPGNTALAVAPKAEYAMVEVGDEYLIMADMLLKQLGLNDNRVVARMSGGDLVGAVYDPLFNPRAYNIQVMNFLQKDEGSASKLELAGTPSRYPVIAGDFVSMEEGTGIVHIAPAYGDMDYQAAQDNDLDFVHTVDLQGKVTGTYPFSGKFIKDADKDILQDLERRGLLLRNETIRHTYPFCWRCSTPLLYYAKQTWYIRTTAMKKELITGNNGINWYPEYIKHGRFGDWLENNVDWAFSRERYWGTPLPVWHCESCGKYDCIGGLQELEKKPGFSGFKQSLDLHRPYVDEVTYGCPECKAMMKRMPEVIDCWFDSGAMPVAQWHYPFDNETIREDGRFPADYICEAVDQTRGWFYSLHAISTLLFGSPSFKNVICLGLILDADGEKMSKAKRNVVEPWAVINEHGADALRWYFFVSSAAGNVRRFSEELVSEVNRRFFLTLWNVYSFFVTYANIDRFMPENEKALPSESELDRWIISELNQLIVDVDSYLDNYNPTDGGRKIEGFVGNLSNWYVRRSRRRFWKSESDADKMAAYTTLYQCLVTLSKLMAPFTPFLAEELYQNLVCSAFPQAPDSVHLADFPVADEKKIDKRLSSDMQLAMRLSSLGRAARSKSGIKIRQPVEVNYVGISQSEKSALERIKAFVLEELNVKDVKADSFEKVANLDDSKYTVVSEATTNSAILTDLSDELKEEGMAREIVHCLQRMRRSADYDITDHIHIYYQGDDYLKKVMYDFSDYIKRETLSEELIEGIPQENDFTENYKLSGYNVLLGVRKLS